MNGVVISAVRLDPHVPPTAGGERRRAADGASEVDQNQRRIQRQRKCVPEHREGDTQRAGLVPERRSETASSPSEAVSSSERTNHRGRDDAHHAPPLQQPISELVLRGALSTPETRQDASLSARLLARGRWWRATGAAETRPSAFAAVGALTTTWRSGDATAAATASRAAIGRGRHRCPRCAGSSHVRYPRRRRPGCATRRRSRALIIR